MKNAFIIHSSYSGPDDHWYPWLRAQLQEQGYQVFVPRFPISEKQSLANWKDVFSSYKKHINKDTLFIGHSIGCAFILRILEEVKVPIHGIILVAPFVEKSGHEGLNLVNATFLTGRFDWKTIHEMMGSARVLASDDDAFIQGKLSKDVADLLGVSVEMIKGAGHFTAADGYSQAPMIMGAIVDLDAPKPSEEEIAQSLLDQELSKAGIGISTEQLRFRDDAKKKRDTVYTVQEKIPDHTTYYGDMVTTMSTADARAMAGILREEREKEERRKSKKRRSITNKIFAVAIVLVVAITIAVVIYIRQSQPEIFINDPTAVTIPTPFMVETQSGVRVDDKSIFQLREALLKIPDEYTVSPRAIHDVVFYEQDRGGPHLLDTFELFQALELDMSDSLRLSLGPDYTYGLFGADKSVAFLLLDIESFDRAYIGMQEWERTLINDLEELLLINPEITNDPSIYEKPFSDLTINNQKMRVLVAPTYRETSYYDLRETIVPPPRPIRIMPPSTTANISTLTDEKIIFNEPDAWLEGLVIGEAIIYRPEGDDGQALTSVVEGINLVEGQLEISIRRATTVDLIPPSPEGKQLKTRINENGKTEYYYTESLLVKDTIKGPDEVALLYTFIDDRQVLITTRQSVITEILERQARANSNL